MDTVPPPIACALDAPAYAERVDRWRRLLAEAEHVPDPGGRTVRLPMGRAGELAALVVAEHECCPFLTFRLTLTTAVVELQVRAPGGAAPVLAELFAGGPC